MSDTKTAHRSKPKQAFGSAKRTYFLVIWWMSQSPYAAVFDNHLAAEAAANVRNALIITISGRELDFEEVEDWFRRDEEGHPMPAEWRDLTGQMRVPWSFKMPSGKEAAEVA
jgi:hypothetical protein